MLCVANAECRVFLIIILSVLTLCVVMLNVMAPKIEKNYTKNINLQPKL